MKPDLTGVRQWGPGKYSELKRAQDSPDRLPKGSKAQSDALRGDTTPCTYCVSIPPQMALQIKKRWGNGKLSKGIRSMYNLLCLSGNDHVNSTTSDLADALQQLELRIGLLKHNLPQPDNQPYPTGRIPRATRNRKSPNKLSIRFPQKPK